MMERLLPGRLRMARAEKGLTLREAAARTGVAKETLSELERGKRHPHPGTLFKVAQGYGISVRDLMEEPVPFEEAPREAGPSAREKSVVELVREAVARQNDQDWQAIARAKESGLPQDSHVGFENEVMMRLLERHPGDLAEACIDLAKRTLELEHANAQLAEELELAHRGAAERLSGE